MNEVPRAEPKLKPQERKTLDILKKRGLNTPVSPNSIGEELMPGEEYSAIKVQRALSGLNRKLEGSTLSIVKKNLSRAEALEKGYRVEYILTDGLEAPVSRPSPDPERVGLFEQYAVLFYPQLVGYVRKRVWYHNQPEEIVQEVLTRMFAHIDNYPIETPESFVKLASRIASNIIIDQKRKWTKEHNDLKFTMFDGLRTEEIAIGKIGYGHLIQLIGTLKANYRDILMEYVVNGREYSDIAQELGVSEGALRIRLTKAKKKLKALLDKEEESS